MKKLFYTLALIVIIGGHYREISSAEAPLSSSAKLSRQLDEAFRKNIKDLKEPPPNNQKLFEAQRKAITTIINNRHFNPNVIDTHNRTPLMAVLKRLMTDCPYENIALCEFAFKLMPLTADINTAEKGTESTALHMAVEASATQKVPDLLQKLLEERLMINTLALDVTGKRAYTLAKKHNLSLNRSDLELLRSKNHNQQREFSHAIIVFLGDKMPFDIATLVAQFTYKNISTEVQKPM